MQKEKIALIIQTLLIKNFNIPTDQFEWESSLQTLDEKFKMLNTLIELEKLLNDQFHNKIALVENIITAFHSPKDIVQLVVKSYDNSL